MLFIFDSLDSAKDFLALLRSGKIIEVKPLGKLYKPQIRPTFADPYFVKTF